MPCSAAQLARAAIRPFTQFRNARHSYGAVRAPFYMHCNVEHAFYFRPHCLLLTVLLNRVSIKQMRFSRHSSLLKFGFPATKPWARAFRSHPVSLPVGRAYRKPVAPLRMISTVQAETSRTFARVSHGLLTRKHNTRI